MKGIYIYDTPTYYVLLSAVRWTFFRPSKTRFPFLYLLQAFIIPAADWLKPDIILYILASQNYNTISEISTLNITKLYTYTYFNNFFPCPFFSRFFYTSDPRFILFLRTAINANRSIRARRHLHVVVDVIAFFTMSRSVAYVLEIRHPQGVSFPYESFIHKAASHPV